ncbi:MAG: hypothetical protein HQL42_16170 [Alphaproteobacteria bacterium]|nr:hypothetical protein [Alphaproteobacteria bacterium]
MTSDRNLLVGLKALLAVVVLATLWVRSGEDVELFNGKHYWGHFYGGFANTAYPSGQGWRTVQNEGFAQFVGVPAMNSSEREGPSLYIGGPYFDRFYPSPFLAALGHRLGLGLVPIHVVYWAINVGLWLACMGAAWATGRRWTGSELGGVVPALLLAGYHVFSVTLDSIKIQQSAIPMLMIGVWVFECRMASIAALPRLARMAFWASFWFIMAISAGAWLHLLVFLALREAMRWDRASAKLVAGAVLALPMAMVWLWGIRNHYGLVSTLGSYSPGKIVTDTLAAMVEMARGDETLSHRFLNYPQYKFFSNAFIWAKGMIYGNPIGVFLGLLAMTLTARARFLLPIALCLFFLGHATMVLVSADHWHYAFNDGPAMLMGFLAIGIAAAELHLSGQRLLLGLVVAGSLGSVAYGVSDFKEKIDNYYGSVYHLQRPPRHVYVCHSDECREILR